MNAHSERNSDNVLPHLEFINVVISDYALCGKKARRLFTIDAHELYFYNKANVVKQFV